MTSEKKKQTSDQLPVLPEKIGQADYYLYRFPILRYDIRLTAICSLKWYITYKKQDLDSKHYRLFLTHSECFFYLRMRKSEWEDPARRDLLLKSAEDWIRKIQPTLRLLSEGKVPPSLKAKMLEEFACLSGEW